MVATRVSVGYNGRMDGEIRILVRRQRTSTGYLRSKHELIN